MTRHVSPAFARSARGGRTIRPSAPAIVVTSDESCAEAGVATTIALSTGPARPAEILPGTAIRIALRIKGLRTRVFRSVELEHHPLRVGNARIRGRVQ